jgi:hypothetical protein
LGEFGPIALERRFLAVPAFYRAGTWPGIDSGSTTLVFAGNQESNAQNGDMSANTSSQNAQTANNFGDPSLYVTESGSGDVGNAVTAPDGNPGSNTEQIQVHVLQSHSATVDTNFDPNNPFPIQFGDFVIDTVAESSGTLGWVILDNGRPPTSGTITVSFSATFVQASDPRFNAVLAFDFRSAHLAAAADPNSGGFVVTNIDTGAVLYDNPNWEADGGTTGPITFTVPAATSAGEFVAYKSELTTTVAGFFANEKTSDIQSFNFDFSETVSQ